MSLLSPFPYFGGKRSVAGDVWARLPSVSGIFGSLTAHEFSVEDVLPCSVPRRNGQPIVTPLTVGLEPVDIAPISVEFGPDLCDATSAASPFSRPPKVPVFVLRILGWRIPSQIFKVVVAGTRVREMAGVVLRGRRRPDECQKHEPLHLAGHNPSINVEGNCAVAIAAHMGFELSRRTNPARTAVIPTLPLERPDRAVAAREVMREAWDLAKVAVHSILIPIPTRAVNGGRVNA